MFTNYKWYRKWRGGVWYKHSFTNDAMQIGLSPIGTWWARYGKINRYSDVVKTEDYTFEKNIKEQNEFFEKLTNKNK